MAVLPIDEALYKRKFSTDQRRKLAKEGKAMPDGSYPIVTAEDLRNAISAFGRGGDKPGLKAYIKRRAAALGKSDMIPDSWKGSVKKETFSKPGTADVSAEDLKHLRPLLEHYRKSPHPFSACKRDQMKHGLSEEHANRRCAVIKDLIEGNTHWRKGGMHKAAIDWRGRGKVVKADGAWTPERVEALDRIGDTLELDAEGNVPPVGVFEDMLDKRRKKKYSSGMPFC